MAKKPSSVRTEGRTLGGMARVYDLVCTLAGLGTGFKRRIVEVAQLKPSDRVLDVGCGTGLLSRLASEQAGEVAGIDAAEGMIAVARSNAQRQGIDIDFRAALIEDLPYPDGHFDVVFSSRIGTEMQMQEEMTPVRGAVPLRGKLRDASLGQSKRAALC